MTIYYSLTFMLLAAEMVTFCGLVAPLPYSFKKRLFTFLSESKISFIFVAILFADALQRMFRVTAEAEMAKQSRSGVVQDIRTDTSLAARKFYAQRNMYLTGFCLFLSLVLTRTFYIILDLIHTQEEYAKLKKATTSTSREKGAQSEDQAKEIAALKKQLEEAKSKVRDYDILKKQAAQNNDEYNRLATELNELSGNKSNKRVD
ncbi:B-cell receptor-associated protein 31-like-domain-containing protein [Gymnopilus junonius]|uniref:Endoplasmic reticulum transmembrane protein n=1 Tax=Gymnopilus junonius TaxID=109634 RepID=A0A9P5NPC5_GYMJU|nr:B-cell receptor-associated protein 31-like-domain-containing protein [Gymnopilus junonius]